MNQNIKLESVDFQTLVSKTNNNNISLNTQSKMINLLNEEFTEQQSRWYIANLYLYLNYHPTNDYPINLENVYKMIGFANKGNAMKTIKSNFIKDEDYKVVIYPIENNTEVLLFRREKQKNIENRGGHNKEDIMLNVDTFKNLCMIAKTQKM